MSTQQTTEQATYLRPDNLKKYLAELFKAQCNRVLLIGLNENGQVLAYGAGPVSTQDALIACSTALAQAYKELPKESQQALPFAAFLNQVATFSVNQLQRMSPDSPMFFAEVSPNTAKQKVPDENLPSLEELQADAELEEAAEAARQEYEESLQQEQQVQEMPAKEEEVPVKKAPARRKTSSAAKSPVRRTTKPKAV